MSVEPQPTRWAVIRIRGRARDVVDTWRHKEDAEAEAMFLTTRSRGGVYFMVEPAHAR